MADNKKDDPPDIPFDIDVVSATGEQLGKAFRKIRYPTSSSVFREGFAAGLGALSPSMSPSSGSVLDDGFLRSFEEATNLQRQIDDLLRAASDQAKALKAAQAGSDEQKRKVAELQASLELVTEKERLRFLLDRVHPAAQHHLRQSQEFRDKFLATGPCTAFVMSVDIRRSTELMLKARSAEQFADFITTLCRELTDIVINSCGVFDKFTGDGILAFFPDFYSGKDAAHRVIGAADKCHGAFHRQYHGSRKSFKTVLNDVGLGIGIDYGSVQLVQVADGLTVVGEPVVYACRLSGAPPRVTLVNQPAYEEISGKFGGFCFAEEKLHEIKHEGRMLAYEVRLNGRPYEPTPPDWLNLSASATSETPKTTNPTAAS